MGATQDANKQLARDMLDALTRGDVDWVRAHYDRQRTKLSHFEDEVFDAMFDLLNGRAAGRRSEDYLIRKVARRFRIPRAYAQEIYAGRPEQIEAQKALEEFERAMEEEARPIRKMMEERRKRREKLGLSPDFD